MTDFLSGIRMPNSTPSWFPSAPTLWLGNLGNEHMTDRLDRDGGAMRKSVQFAVARLLWFLREDDYALVPGALDHEFVAYVAHTRNRSLRPEQFHVIDAPLIGQDQTRDPTIERSLGHFRANGVRAAMPYIHDRATMHLLDRHGLLGQSFSTPYMHAGGAEALNSKAQFRLLAASKGWPVPPGRRCRTIQDFIDGLEALGHDCDRVIAKTNMGVGGLGNLLLSLGADTTGRDHRGATTTLQASRIEQQRRIAGDLGLRATHADAGEVVIEEYVEDCMPVFAEYSIEGDRLFDPELITAGRIESDPHRSVLSGVTVPPLPEREWMQPFIEASHRVAADLGHIGYRGLINIDGLIDEQGRCVLNEVNARMGGSTHLDVIARELIGPHWQQRHSATTHFGECKLDFPTIVGALESEGISWQQSSEVDEGVVVVSNGGPGSSYVELMSVASTPSAAKDLSEVAQNVILSDEAWRPGLRLARNR